MRHMPHRAWRVRRVLGAQEPLPHTPARMRRQPGRLYNFTFSGSVQSDGVSLCILLIRKDLLEGERSKSGRRRVPDFKVPETQYLTSLTEREIASLRNKTIVGSDPGKSNLLVCVNQSSKDGQKQWRISQNERAKRLKSRKNRKLRRNLQNSTNVHDAETG